MGDPAWVRHGELGAGAKCASLVPITAKGICAVKLGSFVNLILRFKVGYTPTNLLNHYMYGELRPMADPMGATLIMHYEQSRVKRNICLIISDHFT